MSLLKQLFAIEFEVSLAKKSDVLRRSVIEVVLFDDLLDLTYSFEPALLLLLAGLLLRALGPDERFKPDIDTLSLFFS